MPASITLRREEPVRTSPDEPQGYGVVVSVQNAVDMPEEIFVFQRVPEYGEYNEDQFSHVASPNDLAELPAGNPVADNNPFYRDSSVTLCFRSAVELEECWGYIKEDVAGLVDMLKSLETLENVEEVTY